MATMVTLIALISPVRVRFCLKAGTSRVGPTFADGGVRKQKRWNLLAITSVLMAVILALMAFGQLLGFVGVLIALPASAVLLVALRRLRRRYMASNLYGSGPQGADSP